jgi:outer membrane protein assembly factor BamB
VTAPTERPRRRRRRRRRSKLPLLAVVLLVIVAVVGVLTRHHTNSREVAKNQALLAAKRARRRARIANTPVTIRGPLPGALLIADRGNDRILLVDSHRKILWRFPTRADRAKGRRLVFDDDTFVEPGGKALISNEEDHQDIVSIDIRTHAVTRLYGTPGVKGGGPNELNWPDDAYVLPDGTLTVADAYNCRILFIRSHRIVRQIGRTGVCVHDPPRTLGAVNGDTPLPGGGVLVSEINGSWIDNFSPTGKLRWSFQAPVAYPSDPQPLSGGRILLADYASPGAAVIVNRRGEVLWRYRPTAGWGVLNHPSLAVMLPNGNIAINDDFNHRVVIVDPHTRHIVWFYGHRGVPGRGANELHTPDGMDFIPLGPHEKPLWQLVHHP